MARAARGLVLAKAGVHALALLPLVQLGGQIRQEWLTGSGGLGADPVAAIEHRLGEWALRFLLIALAVTPLRQLTGQPVLTRFRRLLGLYAFAYASLHLAAYLVLDLGGYWTQVFEEIGKRPYITVGFAAWLLLVPLAATSTAAAMRRLGRRWIQLHRLVYAVGALAVLHLWWIKSAKNAFAEPLVYAAVLALLLGWRVAWAWRRRFSVRRTAAVR
ncbi:MAG TPA: protein-methionine-sulfoxide reductase heme-binding subunit MsrQ [Lysobacter sp.]|nr:protein-methionine-sulfoxide reductase heme-binding subunit MsrQ [Lysobacter sp.]